MWIKTYTGLYLNMQYIDGLYVRPSKIGEGYAIMAGMQNEDNSTIALFGSITDAKDYLDKLIKFSNERVFEVNMKDWNYTGHKKTHKETRHGGS